MPETELIDGRDDAKKHPSTGHDEKEHYHKSSPKKTHPFPQSRKQTSKRKFKRLSGTTRKPYRRTSPASHFIPLSHHSQSTIGHSNQGSAGVCDQKQKCSIRLIRESIAGRGALRK